MVIHLFFSEVTIHFPFHLLLIISSISLLIHFVSDFFQQSMGIIEKIKDIELEISRTQKNKATEFHLGVLKAKLAKYRSALLEPKGGSGAGKGDGFEVLKSGDARVAMIGFPSVGKVKKEREVQTIREIQLNPHSLLLTHSFS
jgi:hypothetical protein